MVIPAIFNNSAELPSTMIEPNRLPKTLEKAYPVTTGLHETLNLAAFGQTLNPLTWL